MRTLVWSAAFVRAFKRAVRRQPELRARVERTLQRLAEDPFHPMLRSHKLKGELAGAWACTVDYDNRILFEFVRNPESDEDDILLLTMGTHDKEAPMDPRCLDHLATDEQLQHFEEQGYLIVKNALLPDQVETLEQAVDRIWEEEKQKGSGENQNLFSPNCVGREQVFIDLLDCPTTFPIVWGILGWNVNLYHSHLGVTSPEASEDEPLKLPLGFHQDSGRVNREMESHPRPRLSLKIAFWLSDVSQPGRGNFYVIPGSHLRDTIEKPEDRNPDGAIPVLADAGDAVFFDRRLWHARSPNHSPIVRKVLFYGYGYRWIRTKDDMTIRPDLFEKCDPIRRQLLGAGTNCNGFFSPKDEDVPLKLWLEEHLDEVPA